MSLIVSDKHQATQKTFHSKHWQLMTIIVIWQRGDTSHLILYFYTTTLWGKNKLCFGWGVLEFEIYIYTCGMVYFVPCFFPRVKMKYLHSLAHWLTVASKNYKMWHCDAHLRSCQVLVHTEWRPPPPLLLWQLSKWPDSPWARTTIYSQMTLVSEWAESHDDHNSNRAEF